MTFCFVFFDAAERMRPGRSSKGRARVWRARCGATNLFVDLQLTRRLRGMRPVQAFLSICHSQEFFFQAVVLFAGVRGPAHSGKPMVFRSHRAIFERIAHGIVAHISFLRPEPERRMGRSKRVPSTEFSMKHGGRLSGACLSHILLDLYTCRY